MDFIFCNICKEYLEKFSYRVYVETDPLGYTFLIAFDEEVNQKDAISKCKKYCEEMVKRPKLPREESEIGYLAMHIERIMDREEGE